MLSPAMESKQGLFLYFSKLLTWRGIWTLSFEWKLKNEISSQHEKFWQLAKRSIFKFLFFFLNYLLFPLQRKSEHSQILNFPQGNNTFVVHKILTFMLYIIDLGKTECELRCSPVWILSK